MTKIQIKNVTVRAEIRVKILPLLRSKCVQDSEEYLTVHTELRKLLLLRSKCVQESDEYLTVHTDIKSSLLLRIKVRWE